MMSVAEAKRRAIPREKWVVLHGCAQTHDKDVLVRPLLHRSPAMHVMGREALRQAGISIAKVQHFDICETRRRE